MSPESDPPGPPARPLPRPFTMHWGSGLITEEASFTGEYHSPCIQLLEYTDGEAAGSVSIRFCYYGHDGRFQRSPLMVNQEELADLRKALDDAPRLKELIRSLVD